MGGRGGGGKSCNSKPPVIRWYYQRDWSVFHHSLSHECILRLTPSKGGGPSSVSCDYERGLRDIVGGMGGRTKGDTKKEAAAPTDSLLHAAVGAIAIVSLGGNRTCLPPRTASRSVSALLMHNVCSHRSSYQRPQPKFSEPLNRRCMQQFGRTVEHLPLPNTVLFRMFCVGICNVMDKIDCFGEVMFAS